MELRQYEKLKFELAEILRAVPWRMEQVVRNRDLFARLAEDRFNLAVVGRYSRGKSTLMNAMLGLDRLPTGIEPLTSVITSVTYGSDEKVVLHFEGSSLFLDVRLDQLTDYVTERGNPGNRRRLVEAEVQLPADLLRRGFRFVDTPGLGSPIVENTRTTEAFLEEADAFIVVTGFDGSLTDEEERLLRRVHRSGRRCFIVMNKMDIVSERDKDHLLEVLRGRVDALGLEATGSIFAVSARDALAARLASADEALAASGLPRLEQELVAFLVGGKHRAFLLGMCTRINEVLAEETGLRAPRRRLAALREKIETEFDASEAAQVMEEPLPAQIPACEICDRVERAVFDFLTRFQGVLRRRASAREDFASHGGMCGPHARNIAELTAPREICTGFAPVLLEQASRLRDAAANAVPGSYLLHTMLDRQGCPTCAVATEAQRHAGAALAARLRAEPKQIASLSAICLPHLLTVAAGLDDAEMLRHLFRHQAQVLERFAENMSRFAVRQDASRRDQMSREERSAAGDGIHVLVGRPNADLVKKSPT